MFFLGVIAALTGTDLYLKEYFEKRDPADFPREMEGTRGLVKLDRNHHAGFPFGFLKEKKAVVTYVPLVLTSAVGGAMTWVMTKKGNFLEKAGFVLAFSGALSNLTERLARGYVVDYFSIQRGRLKNVVLNLGDVYILVGGTILLLKELAGTIKNR